MGVSNRVVAYYEAEGTQPPGALPTGLATVLHVSADELLGLKTIFENPSPKRARLLKRLQKVEELAPADQRAVFKMVEALAHAQQRRQRQNTTPGRSRAAPTDRVLCAQHGP